MGQLSRSQPSVDPAILLPPVTRVWVRAKSRGVTLRSWLYWLGSTPTFSRISMHSVWPEKWNKRLQYESSKKMGRIFFLKIIMEISSSDRNCNKMA